MSDFADRLATQLDRNAQLERQRQEAEQEMDRAAQDRAAADERARQQRIVAQRERHGALAARLEEVAKGLKAAAPDQYIVRMGWTSSGEEFIAKVSTRRMQPPRSLLIELDRDDDEVLARWKTGVGDSLELWRLLEVEPRILEQLVLQVADQELWKSATEPPPFPT